jgi:hypothetical protein
MALILKNLYFLLEKGLIFYTSYINTPDYMGTWNNTTNCPGPHFTFVSNQSKHFLFVKCGKSRPEQTYFPQGKQTFPVKFSHFIEICDWLFTCLSVRLSEYGIF